MQIGKAAESVLSRSVLKLIGKTQKSIIRKSGVGVDSCAVQAPSEGLLSFAVNPSFGVPQYLGRCAFHRCVNDLICSGAEPLGVTISILLPEGTPEFYLKEQMKELESLCTSYQIAILGGHTEVTDVVSTPIVTLTAVGNEPELKPFKIRSGQDIVMTKWAGIEGTGLLSAANEELLTKHFNRDFMEQALQMTEFLSVYKEAKISLDFGAAALHNVSSGGVYGALWELGARGKTGLTVNYYDIPIRQEVIEISEYFHLNPYQLRSGGSLLAVTEKGHELTEVLKEKGISAAVIGRITEGNDRIIVGKEEVRYMEPPKGDEFHTILKGGNDVEK